MRSDPLDRVTEEQERLYEEARGLAGEELADKMYPGVRQRLAKFRGGEGGHWYIAPEDSGVRINPRKRIAK